MFAKRIVTRAVSRSVLFCDACMKMVWDEDDYAISSFALMKGESYTKKEAIKREQFVICRHCYETIAGAYEVHKQLIADGQEGTFQREGITEQEMRALFQFNPGRRSGGGAEDEGDGVKLKDEDKPKKKWFAKSA